jgi:ketosteroid isomerase-like protein
MSRRIWAELEPAFDRLATSFSGGESCEYEVFGAGVSGDLGYVVAIERSVAASSGRPPARYALRVTTVFRREDATGRSSIGTATRTTSSRGTPWRAGPRNGC